MNVLFLTLLGFNSLQERTIYTDLLREFCKNGHQVYVISPSEKREGTETHLIHEENATILRLQIGNTQKTNIIEKGISTVMIEPQFKAAIKKHFLNVKFDLVLYSTPPITLTGAVEYVKRRDGAKTYLLLKDIFPQNAVDIGMMSTSGVKGLLYKHFRRQEKKLYAISDRIGCMSQANVDYVIKHNLDVDPKKVEVCPNSIEVIDKSVDAETRRRIREKYDIPLDKKVFVYGGNLGKPQGIPFLIDCLKVCKDERDAFFLIIGDGTEYHLLEEYERVSSSNTLKVMKRLPKEDYDNMVGACDVGLIFLDNRFTIPNFPSRLLSYCSAHLPVLALTDKNTDIGKIITGNGFGWWAESDKSSTAFNLIEAILKMRKDELKLVGEKGWEYLKAYYTVAQSYKIIIKHVDSCTE